VRRAERLALDARIRKRDLRFVLRSPPVEETPPSPEFEPRFETFGFDAPPPKASWIGRPELAAVSQQLPYATCLAHALCRLQETLLRLRPAYQPLDADMFHQCVAGLNCRAGQPRPARHVTLLRDAGAPANNGAFEPDDQCPAELPAPSRCIRAELLAGPAEAKHVIARHAPVVAIMTAEQRFARVTDFSVYRDGGGDADLNHALLLVGYDDEADYWEVQNSYGTGWGRGGFGRIAYGNCSILVGPAHPAFALY
jgi:hypothetical protein